MVEAYRGGGFFEVGPIQEFTAFLVFAPVMRAIDRKYESDI